MKLIDAEAVAEKLGVPVTWIKERTRARCPEKDRLPCIRLGKYVRFLESDIDTWIAAGCRVMATNGSKRK